MFQLQIISPEKIIYEGNVKSLKFTGIDGETTILANHMAFMTILDVGEVSLLTPSQLLNYTIGKGIFSIKDNKASLLIEDVTNSDELSEERAKTAMQKAQELINKGITGADLDKALYSVRRSTIDLRHIQKRKKRSFQ